MPDTEKKDRTERVDRRVDQLGFISELAKHHGDVLKDAIKEKMKNDGTELVTGDFFQGLRVEGESHSTDPKKLFALLRAKKISDAEFLSAISVKREACLKFLSEKELAKISTSSPASAKLTVTRLKGVQPTLVDAIKALSAELLKEPENVETAA